MNPTLTGPFARLHGGVMDLARYLGVADEKSPRWVAAERSWQRWCATDPELAVVESLADLPAWTRQAAAGEKDTVLCKLAALTAYDRDAATALVWALLPGARCIAVSLSDLSPDIDGLVAGQLWIEVRHAHLHPRRKMAATILACTRREVCADLGVGGLARRRDRAWACSVADDQIDSWLAADERDADSAYEVVELLRAAWLDEVIVSFDVWLLWNLAVVADQFDAPARRGRMGLTTPAVVEEFARGLRLSPRTLRRRAAAALDRVREYGLAREDEATVREWKRRHPVVPWTAREELDLALREEEWWDLMTGEEKLSPDEAIDRVWTGPERRHRA